VIGSVLLKDAVGNGWTAHFGAADSSALFGKAVRYGETIEHGRRLFAAVEQDAPSLLGTVDPASVGAVDTAHDDGLALEVDVVISVPRIRAAFYHNDVSVGCRIDSSLNVVKRVGWNRSDGDRLGCNLASHHKGHQQHKIFPWPRFSFHLSSLANQLGSRGSIARTIFLRNYIRGEFPRLQTKPELCGFTAGLGAGLAPDREDPFLPAKDPMPAASDCD